MGKNFSASVSFGDCDPAGIVFYPNIFRWMDAAFHNYLRGLGGHKSVCTRLNSVGIGLANASAQFRSPMMDGERLEIVISIAEWGRKTVTLNYEGAVGERPTFSGQEIRCLFQKTEKGIIASDISPLRGILESQYV